MCPLVSLDDTDAYDFESWKKKKQVTICFNDECHACSKILFGEAVKATMNHLKFQDEKKKCINRCSAAHPNLSKNE